jgi:hypothetical protein
MTSVQLRRFAEDVPLFCTTTIVSPALKATPVTWTGDSATAVPTASNAGIVNNTAPTTDQWNYAAVEIKGAL